MWKRIKAYQILWKSSRQKGEVVSPNSTRGTRSHFFSPVVFLTAEMMRVFGMLRTFCGSIREFPCALSSCGRLCSQISQLKKYVHGVASQIQNNSWTRDHFSYFGYFASREPTFARSPERSIFRFVRLRQNVFIICCSIFFSNILMRAWNPWWLLCHDTAFACSWIWACIPVHSFCQWRFWNNISFCLETAKFNLPFPLIIQDYRYAYLFKFRPKRKKHMWFAEPNFVQKLGFGLRIFEVQSLVSMQLRLWGEFALVPLGFGQWRIGVWPFPPLWIGFHNEVTFHITLCYN